MTKTAILTDTDASLPTDLAERYHIRQVPILLQFGNESLQAVYDIDDQRTFERIDKNKQLPTTSAPTPGQFHAAFEQAFADGNDDILCFTVSSEISATYSAALNAAEMFPGKEITVINTHSLSMAQGFQVLAAARALEAGHSKPQAIAQAHSTAQRTHLFSALDTLKYIAMSGRVGHLTAGIANLLNVKPILTIQNGKLEMTERVRTQSKAWTRLIELAQEAAAGSALEEMAVIHVNARQDAQRLEAQLRSKLTCTSPTLYAELTPGLSVHSGAGLVGVCFVTRET